MAHARLFWALYSRVYDRLWDNEILALVGRSVAALTPTDARVLEVGAGTGLVTQCLAGARRSVVASEPNPHMARRLARRLPQIPLIPHGWEQVPPQEVDDVLAVNVMHFLPDPRAAVRHLRTQCGPHGRILIVTPRPRAGLVIASWTLLRTGSGIWKTLDFVAVHLVLGPLARLCGVSATMDLTWADARWVRSFETDWPPAARLLRTMFRIFVIPASADVGCDPGQFGRVS